MAFYNVQSAGAVAVADNGTISKIIRLGYAQNGHGYAQNGHDEIAVNEVQ